MTCWFNTPPPASCCFQYMQPTWSSRLGTCTVASFPGPTGWDLETRLMHSTKKMTKILESLLTRYGVQSTALQIPSGPDFKNPWMYWCMHILSAILRHRAPTSVRPLASFLPRSPPRPPQWARGTLLLPSSFPATVLCPPSGCCSWSFGLASVAGQTPAVDRGILTAPCYKRSQPNSCHGITTPPRWTDKISYTVQNKNNLLFCMYNKTQT